MKSEKIYPIRINNIPWVVVAFVGFTLGGLVLALAKVAAGGPPPLGIAIFWLGFVALAFHNLLSWPQSIVHHADDTLEFRAPLGSQSFRIADLESIEAVWNRVGWLRFRHARGNVVITNQCEGLHELIAAIQATNPRVVLRP